MKKSRILLPTGLMIGMLTIGSAFPAFAATQSDTGVFVRGTKINSVDVSKQTASQAKGYLEGYFNENYELKIQDADGNIESIKSSDVGFHLDVTGSVEDILKEQVESGGEVGPGSSQSYTVEVTSRLDDEKLAAAIAGLHCVTAATPTYNAHISDYEEGKDYTIIPESQGNELDQEKLTAAIKEAFLSQARYINLSDHDCYKKVTIKSDDAALVQLCAKMNAYKDVQITYSFGSQKETLDSQTLISWVTTSDNGELVVDTDKVTAYVKSLADKYDTYGNHKYRTTSGRDVVVYGKYGWKINQAAETEALTALVKECRSEEREPVYESRGATHDGYDFGQTYIEIDLATQHLYFYKDGQVIIDSAFVSGNVSKGYTTPPGLFELYYKEKDRTLRGQDYETPVSFWMPFNGGIGMHDATWRSKFGGTIYQTNGSHGCINLPYSVAKAVYENAYKGIPIICCD